jgi:transposase
MSQKERQRLRVLEAEKEGRLSLVKAAELLGVSKRQVIRVKQRYAREGAAGLVHKGRGQPPPNRISEAVRNQVVALSKEKYARFNDVHFTEKLQEKEGIAISRASVQRIRRAEGIRPKRKRRPKQHHKRRPRKANKGAMVLWDGSPHRWFGKERPPCCMMAAVDDADGELLWARLYPSETSVGYLEMLEGIARNHGLPASVYGDRHGALWRNDDHWSLEEQLSGKQSPTQVGMALRDLGIHGIAAGSPQAKGRVERLFGVLQDRLVAEMDLAGIKDMETANAWLPEYRPVYNRRFAKEPAEAKSLFRRPTGVDLETVCAFRYQATVGNDNAVRLGGLIIDIPPGPGGRGYAKAKVEVRQLLDGSWRVFYRGGVIAEHEATEVHDPQRRRRGKKAKGASDWTYVYLDSRPG